MKALSKFFMAVLTSLLFVACSNPDAEAPVAPAKTDLEILNEKYSSAKFTCRLWNQEGKELNLTQAPDDNFSWNLKTRFAPGQELVLESQEDEQQFITVIKLQSFSLQNLSFLSLDGNSYSLKRSPVVTYAYNTFIRYHVTEGAYDIDELGHSYKESREVREHLKDIPVSSKTGLLEAFNRRFFHLECAVETVLNPGFESESVITPIESK